MARALAELPAGSRITDYISLGVLAKTFPSGRVREILRGAGKASIRERDMPAHVVVYYVIALSLYMQSSCREVLRCLLEGVQWLTGPLSSIKVTGRAGISQARKRMGYEPLKQLHDAIVGPIATPETQGPGIGNGGSSVWMAAHWMWPIPQRMRHSSGGRRVRAARPDIPRSGLSL